MPSRRQFLFGGLAVAGGAAAFSAWSYQRSAGAWQAAVQDTWRHSRSVSVREDQLRRELVRYASLAPSSHNTQCWKFRLEPDGISILPDLTRRCPVVDPDDHHLYLSLGCATENLLQAAPAFERKAEAVFEDGRVRIGLEKSRVRITPLYEAITERQSTRNEYDGRKVAVEDLTLLEEVGRGDGVDILIVTDKPRTEQILENIVQGNTQQINDSAFVDELLRWLRFSHGEAVAQRDGLFSLTSGNPALPRWLGSPIFNLLFTADSENDRYARQVRSSAGLAIFSSERSDKAHWIEVGRCFERFALQATALGIRNAHLNQPVEVTNLRPQLASYLGLGDRRPDLVVRFGYAPAMPRSLRRPVSDVII